MTKVVITDHPAFSDLSHEENAAKAENAEFEVYECVSADEVQGVVGDADVVLVQFAPINVNVVRAMKPGSTIIRYGVGYDNIDVNEAQCRGIQVAYVPDYGTQEVADHATSMLLAQLRKLVHLDAGIRTGIWEPSGQAAPILPFAETTIGFLGFGRIGAAVLHRLEGFGFKAIVCDPYLADDVIENSSIETVTIEELSKCSDALTIHAPLTDDTRHVVNEQFLRSMKPDAVIVNTSRGEIIDTQALALALEEKTIASAALDVFEKEPLPGDHSLLSTTNCLLTPHVAWYSTTAIDRLQLLAAEESGRALRGEPLRCPVNN